MRETVKWDELKPADEILACNGVVWYQAAYVVAVKDGYTSDSFLLSFVSPDGFNADCGYGKECVWFVNRPPCLARGAKAA